MQNAFGVVCLVLGVVLVGAQVVASYLEAKNGAKVADAAKKVEQGAEKVQGAAGMAMRAIEAVPSRGDMLNLLGGQTAGVDLEALELAEAKTKAEEAKADGAAAKEKAAEASAGVSGVLTAVAAKAPLAVAGIVLIALGALIMGYIGLDASVNA